VAPEPAGSSRYLREPATNPYPEPTGSTLHPLANLPKTTLIPSSNLHLVLASGLDPSGFLTKTLYTFLSCPMHDTCSAYLILLDYICLMILGDYKLVQKSSKSLGNDRLFPSFPAKLRTWSSHEQSP
jgi:hypothetical protein